MARTFMALALFSVVATPAFAQTGVSDDRVSIPDGPGSVEGLGDNATMAGNMGAMAYSVPFALPAGFASATPSLALSYNSGGGNGIVGMGWSMDTPSIERLTLRGYPAYVASDEFAADGSEQLVRVLVSGTTAVYRARHEGGFVRRTWVDAGPAGYWKAEDPDGSVHYFGARANGTLVPEARLVGSAGETFRYHLVESVDVYGHRIRYDYQLIDGMPYLTKIGYAFDAAGTTPRYSITLAYEPRPDPISDAKPGFESRTTQRLLSVTIATGGEVIRRYAVRYETPLVSGGLSRLVGLDTFGRNGGQYPGGLTFGYSAALTECPTCAKPYLVSMGTLAGAGALRSGSASIVDLDGDSLPDLVDTSLVGAHRIYRNRLVSDGRAHFDSTPFLSAVGTHSGFDAALPSVQEVDLDGDGFSDLANLVAQTALCNKGTGDWTTTGCSLGGAVGVTLEADPSSPTDNDPNRTRFIDIDGDRRIDILRTDATDSTIVRRNTPAGFQSMTIDPIGLVFDNDRLSFADVNGDGMLDPVAIGNEGIVTRRLNLGRGHWSAWKTIPGPTLTLDEAQAAQLEDLNGDGVDDLVIVTFDKVRYSLNRSGERFDPLETIEAAGVDGGIGIRAPTTTVLFADMNASGSVDVVWVQLSGEVLYLELFPAPPNLLSRIDNGLGAVQEIRYGTAIDARTNDSTPWAYPLTTPANVLTRIDAYTLSTGGPAGVGLHDVTTYRYRDGFYDGREKLLRGFARVEQNSGGDAGADFQEPGRTISTYDVGIVDVYRAGKQLSRLVMSGAGSDERVLTEARISYGDCPLADVPASGLVRPVRYVCELERTTIVKEGAPASEWATTRTTNAYDGYGQVTLSSNLGVVSLGAPESPQSCAACGSDGSASGGPCGAACLGDESFTRTLYIDPGTATDGRWILGTPHTTRTYGVEGGPSTEVHTFYDGAPFVGLPLGKLTRGDATRSTALQDAATEAVVAVHRASYDANGNVVVQLDPLGSPDDDSSHRRSYVYDAAGLRVVRTDVHLVSPEGQPYRLRRDYSYEPAFDVASEATAWMVVKGNATLSARNATSYRYDEFARRIAVLEPGDAEGSPTTSYSWELGNPSSRVVAHVRSTIGQAPDIEYVVCSDGLGREYQRRTRISGDSYQVTGFVVQNRRGLPIRLYEDHVGTGSACNTTPPAGVGAETVRYDAIGREVARTRIDASLYGSASVVRTVFSPLATARSDEEDTNAGGAHADTPTIERVDGLGRVVAVERRLADGTTTSTRATFDSLGRLVALRGPEGSTKRSSYDLLGRLLSVDDETSGSIRLERDAVGNVVRNVDGRGIALALTYDGANRPLAQWAEEDPAGTRVSVRYDFGGTCDAQNCTNAAGRMIETTYPVSGLVTSRLGGDATGTDQRGYDARGRLAYEARAVAGSLFATRHTYDAVGRLRSTVHPDGLRIPYRYDGSSRLVGVDGVVDVIEYDARGLPARLVHTNGAVDTFAFDANRRGVARTTRAGSGVALQDLAYTHDRVGNIVSLTDGAPTAAGWSRRDATFGYDAFYRVVAADYTGQDVTVETNRFDYDLGDDLIASDSSAGPSSPYDLGEVTYDATRPSTMTSAAGVAYTYDAAGYMVRRGDIEFEWDAFGRLVRGRRGERVLAEFAYAGGTSRVASVEGNAITLYASPDFEIRDGIAVAYVRVGGQRVARFESSVLAPELLGDVAPTGAIDGSIDAADAWIAHASQLGIVPAVDTKTADPRVVLRGAARRLLGESGDATAALHTDHLGNVVAATDASGAERGYRRFAVPTGENRSRGFVDIYGSFGQEEVSSLGLVRFEHRWLDARSRRWTRPDPLFLYVAALSSDHTREMTNPYSYAANEFVNLVDPTGLITKEALPTRRQGRPGATVMSRMDSVRRIVTGDTNSGWGKTAGENCTHCAVAHVDGSTSREVAHRSGVPEGVVRLAAHGSFFQSVEMRAPESAHGSLRDAITEMQSQAHTQNYEHFVLTFHRPGDPAANYHSITARLHETGVSFVDAQNGAVETFAYGGNLEARANGEFANFIGGLFTADDVRVQPARRAE